MATDIFRNEFVEFVPDKLNEGVLYISMPYRTVTHLCACGCQREVVTPLSPTDWHLIFNGAVTLEPSVGNWNFPCQSHYFVLSGRVKWAGKMSKEAIKLGRNYSAAAKGQFYNQQPQSEPLVHIETETQPQVESHGSVWARFKKWLAGR